MKIKTFVCAIFLFLICGLIFAQSSEKKDTTPEPYTEEEFPELIHDLRRFEIITLGSMPFVTMDAAIVYNGYKYFTRKADKFNPLATADYEPAEMKKIIITSLCVSAGIGLTDFVIRFIKREFSQKKKSQNNDSINIIEDPEAVKIELPSEPIVEEAAE